MPANLPPQARAAERRYSDAKSLPEKIRCLQEFLAEIPEHKGNEKMRGHLRRKLSQLKEELEEQKKRKAAASGGGGFSVKKEGAAQVVILGATGSGKSSLLTKVTNAKSEVADYPFATKEPVPGMMPFEDIQFQLVDTPPIFRGAYERAPWGPQLLGLARNADGLIILLDSTSAADQFRSVIEELGSAGITIDRRARRVEIERMTGGGIQVACTGRLECRVEEISKALKDAGVRSALVRIHGDACLGDVIEALDQTRVFKPSLIVINKVDLDPGARERFTACFGRDALGVSALTGEGLGRMAEELFRSLGIIRVYTKEISGKVAMKPIIVGEGAKVLDIAKIVHSQFYKNFKYARVWGKSVKYSGDRVGADHELMDKDIVEIRTR